jgi:RND superfamily putative drug exporter
MKTRVIQDEPEDPANTNVSAAEPRRSKNVAARMGRWSASHKKTAIFGWLAFVVATFMIGHAVGTKPLDAAKSGSGEAGHVDSTLADNFKQPVGDAVLFQSPTTTVDDPEFRAAINDVTQSVAALKQVKRVHSPFESTIKGADLEGSPLGARPDRAPHDRKG